MYCLIQMSSLSRFSSHLMADFVAKKIIQTLRHHIRRLYMLGIQIQIKNYILFLSCVLNNQFVFYFLSLFFTNGMQQDFDFLHARHLSRTMSYCLLFSSWLIYLFKIFGLPCLYNCLYVCVFRQTFHIKYRYTKCDDKQYRLSIPFR